MAQLQNSGDKKQNNPRGGNPIPTDEAPIKIGDLFYDKETLKTAMLGYRADEYAKIHNFSDQETKLFKDGLNKYVDKLINGTAVFDGNTIVDNSTDNVLQNSGQWDAFDLKKKNRLNTDNNISLWVTNYLVGNMNNNGFGSWRRDQDMYSINIDKIIKNKYYPDDNISFNDYRDIWEQNDAIDPTTKERGTSERYKKIAEALDAEIQKLETDLNYRKSFDYKGQYDDLNNWQDRHRAAIDNLTRLKEFLEDGQFTDEEKKSAIEEFGFKFKNDQYLKTETEESRKLKSEQEAQAAASEQAAAEEAQRVASTITLTTPDVFTNTPVTLNYKGTEYVGNAIDFNTMEDDAKEVWNNYVNTWNNYRVSLPEGHPYYRQGSDVYGIDFSQNFSRLKGSSSRLVGYYDNIRDLSSRQLYIIDNEGNRTKIDKLEADANGNYKAYSGNRSINLGNYNALPKDSEDYINQHIIWDVRKPAWDHPYDLDSLDYMIAHNYNPGAIGRMLNNIITSGIPYSSALSKDDKNKILPNELKSQINPKMLQDTNIMLVKFELNGKIYYSFWGKAAGDAEKSYSKFIGAFAPGKVASKKDGGALKMQFGGTAQRRQNDYTVNYSYGDSPTVDEESTYKDTSLGVFSSKKQQQVNDGMEFTTTDQVRLGGSLLDFASAAAAFIPGLNIASSIAGAASSLGEYGADITDIVNEREGSQGFWGATGELLLNLGMDAVSLIPGGKTAKIARASAQVLPYITHLMGAIQAGRYVFDKDQRDSMLATLSKVGKAQITDLTKNDIDNLVFLGRTFLSGKAVKQQMFTKGNAQISGKVKVNGEEVTVKVDAPEDLPTKNPFKFKSARQKAKQLLADKANQQYGKKQDVEQTKSDAGENTSKSEAEKFTADDVKLDTRLWRPAINHTKANTEAPKARNLFQGQSGVFKNNNGVEAKISDAKLAEKYKWARQLLGVESTKSKDVLEYEEKLNEFVQAHENDIIDFSSALKLKNASKKQKERYYEDYKAEQERKNNEAKQDEVEAADQKDGDEEVSRDELADIIVDDRAEQEAINPFEEIIDATVPKESPQVKSEIPNRKKTKAEKRAARAQQDEQEFINTMIAYVEKNKLEVFNVRGMSKKDKKAAKLKFIEDNKDDITRLMTEEGWIDKNGKLTEKAKQTRRHYFGGTLNSRDALFFDLLHQYKNGGRLILKAQDGTKTNNVSQTAEFIFPEEQYTWKDKIKDKINTNSVWFDALTMLGTSLGGMIASNSVGKIAPYKKMPTRQETVVKGDYSNIAETNRLMGNLLSSMKPTNNAIINQLQFNNLYSTMADYHAKATKAYNDTYNTSEASHEAQMAENLKNEIDTSNDNNATYVAEYNANKLQESQNIDKYVTKGIQPFLSDIFTAKNAARQNDIAAQEELLSNMRAGKVGELNDFLHKQFLDAARMKFYSGDNLTDEELFTKWSNSDVVEQQELYKKYQEASRIGAQNIEDWYNSSRSTLYDINRGPFSPTKKWRNNLTWDSKDLMWTKLPQNKKGGKLTESEKLKMEKIKERNKNKRQSRALSAKRYQKHQDRAHKSQERKAKEIFELVKKATGIK